MHFVVVDSLEMGLLAANGVVEVVAVRFATRGKQADRTWRLRTGLGRVRVQYVVKSR